MHGKQAHYTGDEYQFLFSLIQFSCHYHVMVACTGARTIVQVDR